MGGTPATIIACLLGTTVGCLASLPGGDRDPSPWRAVAAVQPEPTIQMPDVGYLDWDGASWVPPGADWPAPESWRRAGPAAAWVALPFLRGLPGPLSLPALGRQPHVRHSARDGRR